MSAAERFPASRAAQRDIRHVPNADRFSLPGNAIIRHVRSSIKKDEGEARCPLIGVDLG